MQQSFEQRWREARMLENRGDTAAAKAIYEALLAADPHRLYVRMRLSLLEQAAGRYRLAREHALAMVGTVKRGRWEDLVPVGRRLLTFDEHAEACELIRSADWTSPVVLAGAPALSQYLCLGDRVSEGLQLAEAAIAAGMVDPALSYARANALRFIGRTDEATAEYERCLQLRPDYALAHWSLAYHQKSIVPGIRIDRVRAALDACDEQAAERVYLQYALFKELDDAGDADAAWLHLRAGMQAKRSAVDYDEAEEEAGFQALIDQSMSAFGDGGGYRNEMEATPLFIVGMPRTGTTLLERILGAHSQVTAAGELRDFGAALSFESDTFLADFVKPSVVSALAGNDPALVGRRYLERTRYRVKGKPFFIDKHPMNFVHVGHILKALPRAKVLCMRRAPMDACFSNLKELFPSQVYGYSYDLGELAGHHERFDRLRRHWVELAPDRVQIVEYERLVRDPAGTTREVMAFCGLAFEADTVDITRNTAPVSTASSSQVRRAIHNQGIDAWHRYAAFMEPLRQRIQL